MAHFWKTQAKCIKEVRDITLIIFSQNQMIKNHETYLNFPVDNHKFVIKKILYFSL